MCPLKRKKSARHKLKEVYYYKKDFITLKVLSKEGKTSMTQVAHDILLVYLSYKHGVADGETKELEFKLKVLAEDYKKIRDELKLYKERVGHIYR